MDAPNPVGPSRRTVLLVGTAAGAVVVVAVLTAAVVVVDGPLPGELAYIRWLQDFGPPVTSFADAVRITTGTEGNIIVGIVPGLWLVHRHGRRGAAAVAICLAAMLIVQPASKEIIDRDRPSEAQVEVRAEHSSRSYPSGHSLSTSTVWGTAALYAWSVRRRRLAVVLYVPVASNLVASGVHGVHWASDAITGTIVGLTAAWLAVRVLHLEDDVSAVPGHDLADEGPR